MKIPKERIEQVYLQQVERGNQGKNLGLELDPIQYGRLTKYIANIQQGRYDLIGAPTGCGKSSLVLDMYMVNPIRYVEANRHLDITLKILYFNMELPVQNVVAKYVARRIFEDTNGKVRLSVNKIFQKGAMVSKEYQEIIKKYRREYLELMDYVTFYEGSITWKYMYKEIISTLQELGTFSDIPDGKGNIYQSYKYHNPDTYVICIADHIGLLKANKGEPAGEKAVMDATINNCVVPTRNKYGITWALCQQMNRSNEDPNRMRSPVGSEPLLGDFMYSSVPAHGADTVIGLYRPQWFELTSYMGYPIDQFKDFFLSAKLLKNRDGKMGVKDCFGFLGSVGHLRQLPYPEELGQPGFPDKQQIINYFKED